MATEPFIRVQVWFEEAEPDGSPCAQCEDPIFLKAWRCCVRTLSGQEVQKSEKLFCDGCKEAVT